MTEWTTAAGIAATAIMLSNVIVWAWGQNWTPQQKAAVGGVSALIVFFAGVMLFPQEWSDSGTAFTILFEAVLTVLASAGAPVFKEAAKPQPQSPADVVEAAEKATGRQGKTWGVWSR